MISLTVSRSRLGPGSVLFICLFAAQAAILVVSPILPQVAGEFGVSTGTAAQLRSVSGITAGLVAVALATLGNRFRLSFLLNGGLALLAVGSVISAWAPTFALLLTAQAVIGLGLAAVLSGGLAASESWAADGESAKVLSWALIGQPVAWIVGQPLVGLVADQGWRWAFLAVPLIAALVALAAVALRDQSIADAGQECDPLGLWKEPGVRGWVATELLAYAAWAGTLVYAGALFIETYGVSAGTTGLILGFGAIFYLPGNSLGRRLLGRGAGVLMTGFSVAAGAAIIVWGAARLGVGFSVAVFSVSVFFAAGRTIAGAAMGLQISGGRRLVAMSVRTATVQFGYLLGSAFGALLLDFGGFGGIGWGLGLLFVASGLIQLPRALSGESLESAKLLLRRQRQVAEV